MNLQSLPISRLVEIYNLHAEKPVKHFRDKATAVARVEKVLPPKPENKAPKKVDKRSKYPANARINWLCNNPKQRGKAADRAAHYWGAKTVQEFLNKGGTRADVSWDARHNFIEVIV